MCVCPLACARGSDGRGFGPLPYSETLSCCAAAKQSFAVRCCVQMGRVGTLHAVPLESSVLRVHHDGPIEGWGGRIARLVSNRRLIKYEESACHAKRSKSPGGSNRCQFCRTTARSIPNWNRRFPTPICAGCTRRCSRAASSTSVASSFNASARSAPTARPRARKPLRSARPTRSEMRIGSFRRSARRRLCCGAAGRCRRFCCGGAATKSAPRRRRTPRSPSPRR